MQGSAMVKSPADRLREARIAAGYRSALEAATHFEWTYTTYQGHENGSRGIRPAMARKYARAFGISPGELLGVAGGVTPSNIDIGEIQIVGVCQAGVWIEAGSEAFREMPGRSSLSLVHGVGNVPGEKYAFTVNYSPSVSRRINKGDQVIVATDEPITNGSIVVARRNQGNLSEIALWVARTEDG